MAAGIAHEIIQSAAIIHGAAQLLGTFANDPEKMEAKIKSILNATHRNWKNCARFAKILKAF